MYFEIELIRTLTVRQTARRVACGADEAQARTAATRAASGHPADRTFGGTAVEPSGWTTDWETATASDVEAVEAVRLPDAESRARAIVEIRQMAARHLGLTEAQDEKLKAFLWRAADRMNGKARGGNDDRD